MFFPSVVQQGGGAGAAPGAVGPLSLCGGAVKAGRQGCSSGCDTLGVPPPASPCCTLLSQEEGVGQWGTPGAQLRHPFAL